MSKNHSSSAAFKAKVEQNRRRQCRVIGCTATRHAISPYCKRHATAVERYGHPEAGPVRSADYAYESKLVADFLSRHAQHPGVLSACKWLQKWMDQADVNGGVDTEGVPAAFQMQRLAVARVAPLRILALAAALFLYSRSAGARSLGSAVLLDFALGRSVLQLAPMEKRRCAGPRARGKRFWYRKAGKVARRTVGQRIRLTLAPLLVGIAEGIDREREEQQAAVAALHLPFTTTRS